MQNDFSSGMAPTESDFLQMDLDAEVPAEDNFFQTVRQESDFLETTSPETTPEQGLEDPASTPAPQNDEPESGLTLAEWNYTEENGDIVLTSLKDNNAKNVVVPGEFTDAPGKQVYIKGYDYDKQTYQRTEWPFGVTSLEFREINGKKVKITTPSLAENFGWYYNLINFNGSGLDTSNITTLMRTFCSCENLTTLTGLDNWDTSAVTTLYELFYNCKKLPSISGSGMAEWDVSNVTNMRGMFYGCEVLQDISPLSEWYNKTLSLITIEEIFAHCKALETLEAIRDWDVSKVEMMHNFCWGCFSLKDIQALESWKDKISNVKNMVGMFYNCKALTDISPLGTWKIETTNVTSMENMFSDCCSLTDISPLGNWDIGNSKVDNMYTMFCDCEALTDISPLKNWDVSKVQNLRYMFQGCKQLTFADLGNEDSSKWNLSSIVSMNEMFSLGYYYQGPTEPLLVIAKDEKFNEDNYNYAGDYRTPVGPTFDANGGKFPESTDGGEETGISTQAEGETPAEGSEIKQGKTTYWLKNNNTAVDEFISTAIEQPTRDDSLVFCGWEAQDLPENPNAYDRMTATYKAKWGQININANDKEIEQGQAFDPLDGVTATDGNGDLIPEEQITVISNDVDVNKLGDYSVTYEAADSFGNTAQKSITVTVTEKMQVIEPDKNDSGDSKEEEYNWLKTGNSEQIDKFAWIMPLSLVSILKSKCKKAKTKV